MRVEKIMTRDVLTVAPDTSLREVALLLSANHVSGLPVCAPDGSVLGVVSEADILRKRKDSRRTLGACPAGCFGKIDGELDKISARTAGEAMTAPALTARPGQQVSDVARLMTLHKINRLPVVSEGAARRHRQPCGSRARIPSFRRGARAPDPGRGPLGHLLARP